jgi:hypothetical protein
MAMRRMAAVSLAANLFHFDHARWPANLTELSPDYLSSTPVNPFIPGNMPLGYLIAQPASGVERPLVYCDIYNAIAFNPPPAKPSLNWDYESRNNRKWIDISTRWSTQPAANPPSATQSSE